MATMKILFDSQNNPIIPTLLLANRNGNRLGQITNISNIHISDVLSDTPELTFKVSKYDGKNLCHLWDKIIDLKLVYCIEWDTWFEINVELSDGQEIIKYVTATALCQSELSQIMLFGIEINTEDDIARDDYELPTVIYNSEHPEASLLNRITEKTPHYKIKHVDESLKDIQRTFSFDNISIKDALDEIAKEINCLVIYGNEMDILSNSPSRTISLYDLSKKCLDCGYRGEFTNICPECGSVDIRNEYGTDTTIFVTKDNLSDEITYRTNVDSVKNCFRLEGGDDLMTATIRNCNPNGSGYIWYISDDTKSDMPQILVNKLDAYDALYDMYKKSYVISIKNTLITNYNQLIDKYEKYSSDLIKIPSSIIGYSNLMDAVYNTIDFNLYLNDTLMPTYEMSSTDAKQQASLLTSSSLSPIAVSNIDSVSSTTTDNYVLEMAKAIIDSRYQVKIKSSSFNKSTYQWNGVLTVTNYSDAEDTADSSSLLITVTGNYENFIKQKIEKVLSKGDTENYSVSSLMKKNLIVSGNTFSDEFAAEIKKYNLSSLISIHDCCQGCIDVLVEQGIGDQNSWSGENPDLYTKFYLAYYNKLKALEYEINIRETEIKNISDLNDALNIECQNIQEALDFENYLGADLWKIFCSYRRDDLYSNSNYISDGLSNTELFDNAREFISVAEKELYKSATLQHSISSTLKNLLVIKEFKKLVDYFAVGNWIRIEVDGAIYRLRLIGYNIDYDNLENINVEFSDVTKIFNGITDAESILSKTSSMASSYSSVYRQASKGKETYDRMSLWHQDGMDATFAKFMNDADSQDIVFDSSGLLFRKYDSITDSYIPKQLKIINSTIAITDDNWKSTRTAIGNIIYKNPKNGILTEAYGINGEVICGKLLLGEELGIYNKFGNLSFNENGLTITNGTNTFSVNPNNANKLLSLSNSKMDLLYVDNKGELHLRGEGSGIDISSNATVTGLSTRIQANADGLSVRVEKNGVIAAINASSESVSINAGKINLNGVVTANNYFKINTNGSMECTNAKVTGNITATSGYIGGTSGFYIGSTYIRNGNITSAKNTTVSGVYIGTDGFNVSGGTAATTSYFTKNSMNIGGKLTWDGSNMWMNGDIKATSITANTQYKLYVSNSDYPIIRSSDWNSSTRSFAIGNLESEALYINFYSDLSNSKNSSIDIYAGNDGKITTNALLWIGKGLKISTAQCPDNPIKIDDISIHNRLLSDLYGTKNWRCTENGNLNPYEISQSAPGVYDGGINDNSPGNLNIGNTGAYIKNLYYGGSLSKQSDRRIKNPLGELSIDESLILLKNISVQKFTYKNDSEKIVNYGVYAQDLRDILISHNIGHIAMLGIDIKGTDGEKTKDLYANEEEVQYTVDYVQYIPPLINGWKYNESKITQLEQEIVNLKEIILNLRKEIAL